jgi:hypothetical protein
MLFWTVVSFITYSLIYFIVSQRKIKQLRHSNSILRESLNEKTLLIKKAKTHKGHYETIAMGE